MRVRPATAQDRQFRGDQRMVGDFNVLVGYGRDRFDGAI
jgi:hypothetical protein